MAKPQPRIPELSDTEEQVPTHQGKRDAVHPNTSSGHSIPQRLNLSQSSNTQLAGVDPHRQAGSYAGPASVDEPIPSDLTTRLTGNLETRTQHIVQAKIQISLPEKPHLSQKRRNEPPSTIGACAPRTQMDEEASAFAGEGGSREFARGDHGSLCM